MLSWFFLFLGSVRVLNSSLIIESPPEFSETSFIATQILTNTQRNTLFGNVVLLTSNTSIDGKIVLLPEDMYYIGFLKSNAENGGRINLVLDLQVRGAIGVVVQNQDYTGDLYNDLIGYNEINITMVESNCQWLYEKLEQQDVSIFINITFDWNQYYNFANINSPYIIFSIFIGAGAIIGISLASYKLWRLGRIKWKWNVATVCLSLEICGGILRFMYAIDPIGHFNIWPFSLDTFFASLHFPFYFANILLISLYWFMLMRPTKIYLSQKALRKSRIPLFVLAGLLFVLEILENIIRITTGVVMSTYMSAIYGLLDLLAIIFFFWNGFRIYSYLNKSRTTDSISANTRLIKATRLILLSGVISLFLFITGGISISEYGLTPQGNYAGLFNLFAVIEVVSIFQILAFDIPEEKKEQTNNIE